MKMHANINFRCPDCQEKPLPLVSYKQHVQNVHKKKANCFYNLEDPDPGRIHGFPCICGAPNATKRYLLRHIYRIHKQKPPYPCPFCFIVFGNFDECRRHCSQLHREFIANRVNPDGTIDVFLVAAPQMPSNSSLTTTI